MYTGASLEGETRGLIQFERKPGKNQMNVKDAIQTWELHEPLTKIKGDDLVLSPRRIFVQEHTFVMVYLHALMTVPSPQNVLETWKLRGITIPRLSTR